MGGPNEQRTISRDDAGFYYSIIVGGIYDLGNDFNVKFPDVLYYPLQRCIEEHPYLSVTVGDMHTDRAFYQRVPTVRINDHMHIAGYPDTGDDLSRIEKLLASNLDLPLPRNIPPWRIIVLPLQATYFIAFAFSHMIGDGPTGTAFHRTFLKALRDGAKRGSLPAVIDTPVKQLQEPFDTPRRLPISWSYLLAPLIALVLPRFLSETLGLRVSASSVNAGTWTGSPISFDPKSTHTKIKIRELEAHLLVKVLLTARGNEAKLTAVLQQVIARALSKTVRDSKVTNFVSQTAINMRNAIGTSNDEMGDFVSGRYITHPRSDSPCAFSDENWVAARVATYELAESASTLQDQAVGLLRFLPSIRKWTFSKLGQPRDCSFEVSNIGAFTDYDEESVTPTIPKLVFAQPGHVISAPLAFNFVSVKDGNLVYTITWRVGALGIHEDKEESFVDDICSSMNQDLVSIANM